MDLLIRQFVVLSCFSHGGSKYALCHDTFPAWSKANSICSQTLEYMVFVSKSVTVNNDFYFRYYESVFESGYIVLDIRLILTGCPTTGVGKLSLKGQVISILAFVGSTSVAMCQ